MSGPNGEQPVTESLSVEDRLAAQFEPEQLEAEVSQEQPEQEAAPDSEAQPELVEHEYEGKTYQVPPELKEALLRQSDYTRKTTEVSQRQQALEQKELQIKAAENERAFHDKVKQDINQIQRIDFQIEQWKAVDVTGMSSEELWKISRQVEQLKEQRAELSNGINGKWQAYSKEQNELLQQARAKAEEAAAKSVRGWGPELQKALTDYGVSQGYSPAELSQLSFDSRYVQTLWKAHQYDKAQASLANGKVKAAPTVKPGSSNPMPQQVKNDLALRKQLNNPKASSAQKAKAIEAELMRRF